MRTYIFKLYKAKRNKKLHKVINIAGIIYNHCIALHKRYYRLFKKSLNIYKLQKHLTKLKKIDKFRLKGLGIEEPVNSPTFTIIQEYHEGRLPLYHFDVYRIGDIEEMDELGYEEYFYSDGVCLIEWSTLIQEIIPDNAIEIVIEKDLEKGFDYRKITIGQEAV